MNRLALLAPLVLDTRLNTNLTAMRIPVVGAAVKVRNLELSLVQNDLSAIRAETLLVWGTEDNVVPTAQAATVHDHVSHSTLRTLPGAGHFAYMTISRR
ncbi:alpha/beta hydrolase [Nocardia vinacea]|uniref:alpha/beta fold hydrolase n=1 Tax=Nocardia vinacea TaxID=96468 RepID=UPI003428878B